MLIILILVLARPQLIDYQKEVKSEGIDIMLVDTSQSMAAEDLLPDRLNVAKSTVKDFINKRQSDQIGLVVFGAEALLSVHYH